MVKTDFEKLIAFLSRLKFSESMSEKRLQQEIEKYLDGGIFPYSREVRLSPKDCIDFLTEDGFGIEIKVRGSAVSAYRQIERYTSFEEIKGIILLTWKQQALPSPINGKPAKVICMADAWL